MLPKYILTCVTVQNMFKTQDLCPVSKNFRNHFLLLGCNFAPATMPSHLSRPAGKQTKTSYCAKIIADHQATNEPFWKHLSSANASATMFPCLCRP